MKNLILHPTKGLSETQWQELRRTFSHRGMTGGSDAGTLLGFNKWKSPISAFYQALGLSLIPFKMNMEMLMGKLQEDNIAESWQYYDESEDKFIDNVTNNVRPRRFKLVKAIIENPKYPTLFANIDGLITQHPVKKKKKGILEIKKINGVTVDSYIGGLPPQYIAQCQHYMLVCELDYAELCMRVDGRMLKVELIEKDPYLQQAILEASIQFQQRVFAAREALEKSGVDNLEDMYGVVAKFEPEADASDDFNAFMSEKHKLRQEEISMQGDETHLDWARQYTRYNNLLKTVEEHKQLYMNRLKQAMEREGASIMNLDGGKITWRRNFQCKLK